MKCSVTLQYDTPHVNLFFIRDEKTDHDTLTMTTLPSILHQSSMGVHREI